MEVVNKKDGNKNFMIIKGIEIDENDYKDFSRRGAVGDCCSHFIKQNGELFDKKIDARVVGASLETIKKIPNKLVVAVGKEKEKITRTAWSLQD